MLAAPGRTVESDTVLPEFQKGLVVIDYDSPISKGLLPKPCVGGFSSAAVGGEEIAFPIYCNSTAVKQQNAMVKEILCKSTLDGCPFQKGVCKDSGLKSIPVRLLQKICLLKINVLPGDGNEKLRGIVC